MFLHMSVILFTGGGVPGPGTPPGTRSPLRQVHTPGTRYTPPDQVHPPWTRYTPTPGPGTPPGDGYCCGRYASYWNAFLFLITFAFPSSKRTIEYFPGEMNPYQTLGPGLPYLNDLHPCELGQGYQCHQARDCPNMTSH